MHEFQSFKTSEYQNFRELANHGRRSMERSKRSTKFPNSIWTGHIKKGEMCISILLFMVLVVAAVTDVYFDKVYNEWILFAILTGLSYAVWKGGTSGLILALISMSVPICLLYPLFMIGCLGAGDIKLLAAVGCFLPIKETVACLMMSFLTGAFFSLLKMIAEKNFLSRMSYFLSYVCDVARSGEWKLYEEDIKDVRNRRKGKIHFALSVLLGVAFYKGGIFL